MMGYYYGQNMFGPSWGIFSIFLMIIFWVAVIYLVIWVVREISGRNYDRFDRRFRKRGQNFDDSNKDALDILKERYAKGEINKAEFEAMKKDITS